MTRSQRILLVVCLPLFAWLVHFNLCDWDINGTRAFFPSPYERAGLWTWQGSNPATGQLRPVGLFGEPAIDRGTALMCGVFLPLALIAAAAFAALGFRSHHRHTHGLCAKCGYDLRGCIAERCPECGSGEAAHRRDAEKL
jgi:ribosomal protein L37E